MTPEQITELVRAEAAALRDLTEFIRVNGTHGSRVQHRRLNDAWHRARDARENAGMALLGAA